jgi:outer membrane protein OmpA-like peptidoglycan-associated protein
LLTIDLQPVVAGDGSASAPPANAQPVVLRNVFFETGSAALRPESAAELDRLKALLEQYPQLRIRINGHTDNVGNDSDNQKLSEARAQAVQDYLLRQGIAAARLQFKGFGESRPLRDNDSPEGRAQNRRTEFVLW